MKRTRIGLIVLLLLLLASVAAAREIRQGDQCTINADETVEGNLFVLCRNVTIAGQVEGNVIGAAANAVITGTGVIEGGVYLAAGRLDVYGAVGENLHYAGPALTIYESADFTDTRADLFALSLSSRLQTEATLPGSIVAVGYQMAIEGTVRDEVDFWGSALLINGDIGGDVNATVGATDTQSGWLLDTLLTFSDVDVIEPGLRINETGSIDGKLTYSSPSFAIINGELAEDAEYIPIARQNLAQINIEEEDAPRLISLYFSQVLREVVTLGLIGAVGLFFAPQALQDPITNLRSRPLTSLGVGLLTFILSLVTVLVMVILSILILVLLWALRLNDLIIGVGVILGMIDLGSASLFVVTTFVARVIVCVAVGRVIIRTLIGDDGSQRILFLSMIMGVIMLSLVWSLPFVGWIFNGLALFIGFGAILIIVRARLDQLRDTSVSPAPRYMVALPSTLPRHPEDARQFPPPMIDDSANRTPGTDNLPEGFQWWD